MEEIKRIVEKLELNKLKEEYLDTLEFLFYLERQMADLTFQYEVGWYAHRLDEMEDIAQKIENSSPEKRELLCKKLKLLMIQNQKLEKMKEVELYKRTRRLYEEVKRKNNRYHQTLQKEFRDELRHLESIPYYVYQGEENASKHILFPEKEKSVADFYPVHELKSKRDLRHFYNQISYKYLESISQTYDFNIEHNKVGRIKK